MNAAQLTAELSALIERIANIRRELEELKNTLLRTDASIVGLREEVQQLKARQEEQAKRYDVADNRRFAVLGLFIGAVLSLGVQAVVTLYLRK